MNDAEQQESYERTMRQHFEQNWRGAEKTDGAEYWTMRNAKQDMRTAAYNPDRV